MRTLSTGFLSATGRYYARLLLSSGAEIDSGSIVSLSVTGDMTGSTDRLTLGASPAGGLSGVLAVTGLSLRDKGLTLYIGRMVGGALEEVEIGHYTVSTCQENEGQTSFTAYDRMYTALETGYYPSDGVSTALAVLADLCSQAGVTLGSTSGLTDVAVSGVTSGYTCREMAGYMAALLGCNACMDSSGALVLRWFADSGLTLTADDYYSGGLSLEDTDWTLGKITCTVTTSTTTTETDEDGASTESTTAETETLTAGTGATGVSLENRWMTQAILDGIWATIGGLTYRGGSVSCVGGIQLEPGDIVTVTDRAGVSHAFPVMGLTMEYDGGLKSTITAAAESESDGGGDGVSGPITTALERYTAELASFQTIYAQNLTVTNGRISNLQAETASIQTLVATKASVDDLTAVQADITSLQAADAEITNLVATKADITDLTAAQADITELTADVANVENILAGNVGTGTLQAIHVTGDNAVFEDAVIADAAIASLTASKLTAGTIYTSLINVASDEDEHLLLDGAGLQLKDGAGTVRVQIGQDGAGDYNLSLWDASGTLLWDASGVYAAGLHDGIIRDVAVAEDAAISGSKLDIASVAQRLNEDGSITVDAANVTIDETTLDVAYKTVTQAATQLESRTETLETDLTVVQGQITSKVWQSDITTAVDDIQIGGRNLARGTSGEWSDWWTPTADTSNRVTTPYVAYLPEDKAEGDKYAVQVEIEFSGVTASDSGSFRLRAHGAVDGSWATTNVWYPNLLDLSAPPEDGVYRYSAVSTIRPNAVNATQFNIGFRADYWGSGKMRWRCVKVERGNQATDWTPAPEDTESALTTLSDQYSTLTQTVDSISLEVGSVQTTVTEQGSSITDLTAQLALKVGVNDNDQVVSMLNASADEVTITGNRLVISSDNFALAADGTLTAANANISGTITGSRIYCGDEVTVGSSTVHEFEVTSDGVLYAMDAYLGSTLHMADSEGGVTTLFTASGDDMGWIVSPGGIMFRHNTAFGYSSADLSFLFDEYRFKCCPSGGSTGEYYISREGNLRARTVYAQGTPLHYAAGNSISNFRWDGAGYLTNGGASVCFTIPLDRVALNSPTVTMTSVNGFILRQEGKYTHGSASETYVKPSSMTAAYVSGVGVRVVAVFGTTTNAVNNAPVGIVFNGTLTFS